MKAVILAGGRGSRISEETETKPKPMIEIGGKPILWHIMKIYSHYGINDFIICCGYKGYMIKEYFANYLLHTSDITIDLSSHGIQVHQRNAEPWRVTLIDTGEDTMTGGRLKRVRPYLEGDESFCFTYGDGIGNIDIKKLIEFHHSHGLKATLTGSYPPARYGALELTQEFRVKAFKEKPKGEGGMVNAGFFVLSTGVIDLIEGDHTFWEKEPLEALASQGQLGVYAHEGFWYAMDTLRDKNHLEELWQTGNAPWRIW